MNKYSFLILFFLSFSLSFSQAEFSGEAVVHGMYSNSEQLPFWMYHNQRGRISENTNLAGWVSGKMEYELGNAGTLEIGGGVLYQDGLGDQVFIDEAYAHFETGRLYITAGRKQQKELYNGLSATNENILWSLNTRPLPGVEIGTVAPVFILPSLAFEASLGEYLMEKDRHVPYARVHHKSFHLVFQPNEDWQFRAGILHFAQWGGTSPDRGKQPSGFTDYLRVFAGRAGGENAVGEDRQNVLGNHLGSWVFEAHKEFEQVRAGFIFNNLFEDGSGSRFANFPDGRYGIFLEAKEPTGLVHCFMYEFYYTKDQSKTGPHLYDQYFNNFPIYNSGWTFHNKVIGAPFFTYDPELDRIINNKFVAHHFGISGKFKTFFDPIPYKLLLSYRRNKGTYGSFLNTANLEPEVVSTYLSTRLYNGDSNAYIPNLVFDLHFAVDFNKLSNNTIGAGASLKYLIR